MTGYVSVLRETVRTLACRPWRSIAAIIVCALCIGLGPLMEGIATQHVVLASKNGHIAGVDVIVVRNPQGTLSGSACEALNRLPLITAAGGIGELGVVGMTNVPGVPFRSGTAPEGYFHVLYPELHLGADTGAAVAGAAVPSELGVRSGARVTLTNGYSGLLSIAPEHVRASDRERWITVLSAPLDVVDECWVEAVAGTTDDLLSVLPSWFSDAEKIQAERLQSPDSVDAAIDSFVARPSALLGLAGGGLAGACVAVLVLFRRHEYALYRISGLAIRHVRAAVMLEAAAVIAAASFLALSGTCLALAPQALTPSAVSASLAQFAIAIGCASVGAFIASVMVAAANPSTAIRSR